MSLKVIYFFGKKGDSILEFLRGLTFIQVNHLYVPNAVFISFSML